MNAEKKVMRDVFIEKIYSCMHEDDGVFFLTADFGSPKLDKIREEFKSRFINVGIAEQNLINVSTGLALEGFTVYAYAIAPFLTMRAFEQIRINLALYSQVKDINVNLIGVGAGLSYDVSGPTHHCLEDISIMRALPNITVFSPSDWVIAEGFIDYSINVKTPKYIRFDGKALPALYKDLKDVKLENGFSEMIKGSEVCLISTGYMTHKAIKVANMLLEENIMVGVIDMFLLTHLNESLLSDTLKKYSCLITIEEAFINKGGLDSLISRVSCDINMPAKLIRMGFKDRYVFEIGDRDYLHKINGLDERDIIKNVKEVLKRL